MPFSLWRSSLLLRKGLARCSIDDQRGRDVGLVWQFSRCKAVSVNVGLKTERTSNNEEISQTPASTHRLWNFGRRFSSTEQQPSSCTESEWSPANYGREHCPCALTGARCR